MNGQNTRMKSSSGLTSQMAVASGRSSAIHFGASSPKTISAAVMMANAIATAMLCAVRAGEMRRQKRERRLEDRGERRLGQPAEAEARHRDAELRRGDVAIGRGDGAAHGSRAAVPFGDHLIDARLAHRDDRELGGDEEAVGAHQRKQPHEPPQRGRERVLHGRNLTLFCC